MSNIHIEVLLASGYALFLVMVAICLEKLGRHSQQRSRQYQTAGFTYHQRSQALLKWPGHERDR